jgi:hypothetical protein
VSLPSAFPQTPCNWRGEEVTLTFFYMLYIEEFNCKFGSPLTWCTHPSNHTQHSPQYISVIYTEPQISSSVLKDFKLLLLDHSNTSLCEEIPPAFTLVYCSAYSTLMMEAKSSFETSVDFQQTTWRYITEDNTLHHLLRSKLVVVQYSHNILILTMLFVLVNC